jgi:hypothetical protein
MTYNKFWSTHEAKGLGRWHCKKQTAVHAGSEDGYFMDAQKVYGAGQ